MRHISIKTFTSDQLRDRVIDGAAHWDSPKVDRTDNRLRFWDTCFETATRRNLRMDTAKWTMRDDRLGILSQPVSLAEWPECTNDDAEFELAREVWCECDRMHNLETMP